jgi:adenine-specific DNA-methyltransferase
MARKAKAAKVRKKVVALKHDEATRKNLATAELAAVAERIEEMKPIAPIHYPRTRPLPKGAVRDRDPDLDPQIVWNGARIRLSPDQLRQLQDKGELEIGDAQLVWRAKDRQDWSDLVVQAPQIYIQEKVHPKAIIDDLIRRSKQSASEKDHAPDLFADFNGLHDPEARLEFYQHDQHWSNRMILGDSLYVMASLAEREHLRGQVQCIYIDPPYGVGFNSNWQVSTFSKKVDDIIKDVSREPEQVKAFRDTWKDGIHTYLTYLRDRITVAHDLLADSGSIFIQISDENVHRVRAVLDEVFGPENFCGEIAFSKTSGQSSGLLATSFDYLLWFAKAKDRVKFRRLFEPRPPIDDPEERYVCVETENGEIIDLSVKQKRGEDPLPAGRILKLENPTSQTGSEASRVKFQFQNQDFAPGGSRGWSTSPNGMARVEKAGYWRIQGNSLWWKSYRDIFPFKPRTAYWSDTRPNAFSDPKIYVVQTNKVVIQHCILATTDPGDLVLDPTCGAGTTATVCEQWGRRWITIDTSRVALALARTRIMSARYPYYYLMDSPEGRAKDAEITRKAPSEAPTHSDIRMGFVYERGGRPSLKTIANNTEIDVIWETFQAALEPLRNELNAALKKSWEEWEIPREPDPSWTNGIKEVHSAWWEQRIARQRRIDDSIAKGVEVEFLFDRPYDDKSRVRVAGPFTVESLSPHRVMPADEEDPTDTLETAKGKRRRSKFVTPPADFAEIVLEHLRTAGVQQTAKKDAIKFISLQGWPGEYIGAEGRFMEGQTERRAAIFFGPEFGTVSRVDLVAAAREATEARFDVLIGCAFNFDAHASELSKLGPLQILKAKMNPDLHMADELKNTGKGNLFVVFGEPDIEVRDEKDGRIRVRVKGVDVFDPNTGEIRSHDTEGIAAWFIDTDYDEQNFFVRHAYFLGTQDPYKSLKSALRAEVDKEAWDTLYRDTSRSFPRPSNGRIAVKVISHFGDEVMKVFSV